MKSMARTNTALEGHFDEASLEGKSLTSNEGSMHWSVPVSPLPSQGVHGAELIPARASLSMSQGPTCHAEQGVQRKGLS